jgi:hypothetical protein
VSSFCERLPVRGDTNTAIFVGRVQRQDFPVVRFEVIESFLTAEVGSFQAHVTSDVYLDGLPVPSQNLIFRAGDMWLIEAKRGGLNLEWTTSECQRTKPIQKAGADLQTLRVWVAGARLPGRVFGEVFNPQTRRDIPGAVVVLTGDGKRISTTADEHGLLTFGNLDPGNYEVTLEGGKPSKVDLTQAWCSHIVLLVGGH